MSGLALAFYRGHGTFLDRVIRLVTDSPYSHVELVQINNASAHGFISISASSRDGGVREKQIVFKPEHWAFLHVGYQFRPDAWIRAQAEIGHPYDYVGILFNFAIPLRRHIRTSWFCSELCGHALGIENPHRLSPGGLYEHVCRMFDKN